jgi:hypothetical protein
MDCESPVHNHTETVKVNTHARESTKRGGSSYETEMWEHRNAVLHNRQLESSRKMREAEINDSITKLYEQVNTYSAENRWCFDIPLATRLCKPLQLRCRWLVHARILAKSEQCALIGQTRMNQYYPHLPSIRIADWIYLTVYSDNPIELVEFPYAGTQLKNLKLLALMLY